MQQFGTSTAATDKILSPHSSEKSQAQKSVSQLAHDLQVKQTSGDELKRLCEHIISFFQSNILLQGLREHITPTFYVEDEGQQFISLKNWTSEVFINAGQNAYFGEELLKLDPELPQILMRMDELSWQAFYGYPWFLRRELNRMSQRVRQTLERYFQINPRERHAQAWFTRSLESHYRNIGLDDKDIAAQMLFLYWG